MRYNILAILEKLGMPYTPQILEIILFGIHTSGKEVEAEFMGCSLTLWRLHTDDDGTWVTDNLG